MDEGPRFLDAGDCGLVVEFGTAIDEAVNRRVMALDAALASAGVAGIAETIPTYRSLLVLFDPATIGRAALRRAISGVLETPAAHLEAPQRRWRVPVHYGGACGEDLDAVAAAHGLTTDEVVALHSGAEYRVYMIGFAPGFAYLGGLPEALHTSRRTTPRPKTPRRSISIGGRQAAVSPPLELPSGWHLLGRTPVRSYDPRRTAQPFLFGSGDLIRFAPIGSADYERLCAAAEAGDLVAEPGPARPDLT